MFRTFLSALALVSLTSGLQAQTPVSLPPTVGGPPATVIPAPSGGAVVIPAPANSIVINGKLTLESHVARLYKEFGSHGLEKWTRHTDYSVGFLIPGDRINAEEWANLAKEMGLKNPPKMEEISSVGVYSYDGKTFKSAVIVVGAKGAARKVHVIDLTAKGGNSHSEAVVDFFAHSHHAITEERGKDFGSGTGGKGP